MNKHLNIKAIVKQIKHCGKYGRIIWSKQETVQYIGTSFWAFRLQEIPRDILCALFSIFLCTPTENQTLVCYRGDVSTGDTNPFTKAFDLYQPTGCDGVVTPFLEIMSSGVTGRIINSSGNFIRVNEEYINMLIVESGMHVTTKTQFEPVFLLEGNVIIMPYRMGNSDESKDTIDKLIQDGDVG